MQISRIRLSDKTSRLRPRHVEPKPAQAYEPEVPVEVREWISEGFSHFVTSMTAPIASGWSGCRVGLAPTGKLRLVTAHTQLRHLPPDLECGALIQVNARLKTRFSLISSKRRRV